MQKCKTLVDAVRRLPEYAAVDPALVRLHVTVYPTMTTPSSQVFLCVYFAFPVDIGFSVFFKWFFLYIAEFTRFHVYFWTEDQSHHETDLFTKSNMELMLIWSSCKFIPPSPAVTVEIHFGTEACHVRNFCDSLGAAFLRCISVLHH